MKMLYWLVLVAMLSIPTVSFGQFGHPGKHSYYRPTRSRPMAIAKQGYYKNKAAYIASKEGSVKRPRRAMTKRDVAILKRNFLEKFNK